MACVPFNPVVSFVDDCPTIILGPLDLMFLTRAKIADQLPNPFILTDLSTRISNVTVDANGVGPSPIRRFSVIGTTTQREVSEIALPLKVLFPAPGAKTFTGKIMDLTQANIDWAVAIEDAGGKFYKAWFQGSSLFMGGYQGMNGFLTASVVFQEGNQVPIEVNWTFKTFLKMNAISTTLLEVY